jgi:hypothetical protein
MAVRMNSGQYRQKNTHLRLFTIFTLVIAGMFSLPRSQSQEQVMSNSSQPAVAGFCSGMDQSVKPEIGRRIS